MHLVLISSIVGLFLTGIACAAVLPKVWQRVMAFVILGLISVICIQSLVGIAQKKIHVWHYGKNIRPTNRLLEVLADDLRSNEYTQAQAHLDFIQSEWKKIAGRTDSFSADDILKKLENESEQGGAPNPLPAGESK